jgi:hypothetical protein
MKPAFNRAPTVATTPARWAPSPTGGTHGAGFRACDLCDWSFAVPASGASATAEQARANAAAEVHALRHRGRR